MSNKTQELIDKCQDFLRHHAEPDATSDNDYILIANCKAELERLSQPTIKTDNTQVILNLQTELERLQKDSEWQPIELFDCDKYYNEAVLLGYYDTRYNDACVRIGHKYHSKLGWVDRYGVPIKTNPMYFMVIPDLPKTPEGV